MLFQLEQYKTAKFFIQVTHNSHRYLKEVEMREEGGTPAIVESIRAGLVFQLKEVTWLWRCRNSNVFAYSKNANYT